MKKIYKHLMALSLVAFAAQPAFSESKKKGGRTEETRPSKPSKPGGGRHEARPDRPGRPNRPGRPHRPDVIVVRPPGNNHHHHYYDRYPYYNDGYYYGSADCSPEVKTKSVNAVELKLGQMLKSQEFSDASVLKDTLGDIQSSKNLDQKIDSYLDLVGVNYKNPKEVVEFVGSRGNERQRYISRAQTRLKLSDEQAQTLVEQISKTLLSGLNQ